MLMPRTVLAGQMLAAVVVVLAAFTGVHGACPAEDAVTPAPPRASRFTLPSWACRAALLATTLHGGAVQKVAARR